MNLSEIITELKRQASGGQITLYEELWNQGSVFSSLVKDVLGRCDIILEVEVSSIPDIENNKVSFIAGIPNDEANSFLFLSGRRVTVEFLERVGVVLLNLSIEPRTKYSPDTAIDWEFGDSFPELKENIINNLSLSDPKLVFQYDDANADPSRELGFSADYTWNEILGVYKNIITAFNGNPVEGSLQGIIDPSQKKIKSLFNSSLSEDLNFDLVKLKVNSFSLEINQMWLEDHGDRYPWLKEPASWTEFSLKGKTYLEGVQDPIDTYIYALPGDYTPDKIGVSVSPAENSTSTSLENLAVWMSGDREAVDEIIKDTPFEEFFDNVGLKLFSYEFDMNMLTYLSFLRLQVGTLEKKWKISDHLIVNDVTLDWLLFNPLENPLHIIELSGALRMLSGDKELMFFGQISLPGPDLSMMLKTEQNLTVPEWLEIIIVSFGGEKLPEYIMESLKGFELKSMAFRYQHSVQNGTFTLASAILAGDKVIDFEVYLHVNFKAGTYDVKVAFILGDITIHGEITNEKIPGKTIIFCDVESENQVLSLDYLPSLMGYGPLGIPPELDIALNKVGIIYDFEDTSFAMGAHSLNYGTSDLVIFEPKELKDHALFAGVYIDKTLDLTQLPLVGKVLSAFHQLQFDDIKVFITSEQLTESQAVPLGQYINILDSELKGNYPSFPDNGMTSSVGISFDLNVAGYIIPITAGLGGTTDTGMPPDNSGKTGTPGGDTSKPVPASPPDQSDGTFWINIQKSIGPILFRRVGLKYKEGILWLSLDCSLHAGGLKIDLMGASMGTPLSGFHPRFDIHGLGIEFKGPGLDIGGTLLKAIPGSDVEWEYAGGAIVKVMNYSLSAWGSYANIYTDQSHSQTIPSMFLFVQFTGTLGGPPFFVVSGLSGGFGYNSRLRLPHIDEVYQFPFVASAGALALKNKPAAPNDQSPAGVMRNLFGLDGGKPWLVHEAGQYWLALGLMFKSFELVNTNALLVVEFGNNLKLALTGISRGMFPTTGPKTYAFVELQIELIIDVEEGYAGLLAQLSPNSYVLDPGCHTTGGFAFYIWYAPSPHAGDFVLVLGGYHSEFSPPDYYPAAPRVGISWNQDSFTTISGTSYFAITPSAMMAGGMLNINYQKGNFKAWLKAWTDLLMYWHPFHFDVNIGVTVGASYRVDEWFIHHTFSGEFGLDMNLYGPKTGAKLTVHIWKIKVQVQIGDDKSTSQPLTWEEFRQNLLPEKKDLLKFIPKEGFISSYDAKQNKEGEPLKVRASGCTLQLLSYVPCSELLVDNKPIGQRDKIFVRPMGNVSGTPSFDFKCILTVKDQSGAQVSSQWQITADVKNVPKALWGKYVGYVENGDEQLLYNQLTGYHIESPHEKSPVIGIYDIKYNTYPDSFEDHLPLTITEPLNAIAKKDDKTVSIIENGLASDLIKEKRDALFMELGNLISLQSENERMDSYAANASAILITSPLLAG